MEENKQNNEQQNNDTINIKISKATIKQITIIIIITALLIAVVWLCSFIGKRYDKNDNGGRVPFWTAVLFDPPELKIDEEALKKDPTKLVIDIDKKGAEYEYIIISISLTDKESYPYGFQKNHLITATRTVDQITYQLTPEELLYAKHFEYSIFSYYCKPQAQR